MTGATGAGERTATLPEDTRPRFRALYFLRGQWETWGWYHTWHGAEVAANATGKAYRCPARVEEWGPAELLRSEGAGE